MNFGGSRARTAENTELDDLHAAALLGWLITMRAALARTAVVVDVTDSP
jgi:hypothetical protein